MRSGNSAAVTRTSPSASKDRSRSATAPGPPTRPTNAGTAPGVVLTNTAGTGVGGVCADAETTSSPRNVNVTAVAMRHMTSSLLREGVGEFRIGQECPVCQRIEKGNQRRFLRRGESQRPHRNHVAEVRIRYGVVAVMIDQRVQRGEATIVPIRSGD